MVEVPGTVKILESILKQVDFVSIGTNDLIQYTLAVDRNNEKVAALYNPLHPAVISLIGEVVATCQKNAKPVSVCGDAAADPPSALLYLAMQVDHLSMNPVAIPVIKNLVCMASLTQAKAALQSVLQMEDEQQIADYLDGVCSQILDKNLPHREIGHP
jgi:phosphoenolpyruvate-protein kinase (PTS system EI component)